MWTSRSAFGYGNGSRSTASTTLKIAALAPIASASVTTTTSVNPGARPRARAACLKSLIHPSMPLPALPGRSFARVDPSASADDPVAFAVATALLFAWWSTIRPSNTRNWQPDVARPPHAEVDGDRLTIHDVRNFDYRSETDFTERWETRTYDLSKLDRLDFFIAELKKRGIYSNLNLNVGRTYKPGDNVPDSQLIRQAKGMTYIGKRLLELQRDWGRAATYDLTTGIARRHGGAYGLGIIYAKTMFGGHEG